MEAWTTASAADEDDGPPCEVILLLATRELFATLHQVARFVASAGRAIQIVVVSSRPSRGELYAAFRCGAKAYIDLNADAAELVRAIRAAVSGKAHFSPSVAQLLIDDIASAEPTSRHRLAGADLSEREIEIVQLLCEGLSSKQIAQCLHVSPKTIENHRYNIYRKCDVDNIAALIRHAIQRGLVAV